MARNKTAQEARDYSKCLWNVMENEDVRHLLGRCANEIERLETLIKNLEEDLFKAEYPGNPDKD